MANIISDPAKIVQRIRLVLNAEEGALQKDSLSFPDPDFFDKVTWHIFLGPLAGIIAAELFLKLRKYMTLKEAEKAITDEDLALIAKAFSRVVEVNRSAYLDALAKSLAKDLELEASEARRISEAVLRAIEEPDATE